MRVAFPLIGTTMALLAACLEAPGEQTEATTATIVTTNRLSTNRLSTNRLSTNRLSTNRIAAARISANRLAVNMASAEKLLSTEDGREVFSVIVSCALPSDVSLEATIAGDTFSFFGETGLAAEWLVGPMSESAQRWVSACIFARVNAHEVAIPISLRGGNAALATDVDERLGWSLEEGAFYGDLFVEEKDLDKPIQWFACRGAAQAKGEVGALVDRDCAEPDPENPGFTLCGFMFTGDCGGGGHDRACEQFGGGGGGGASTHGSFYQSCHSAPVGGGKSGQATDQNVVFAEVITAYVLP